MPYFATRVASASRFSNGFFFRFRLSYLRIYRVFHIISVGFGAINVSFNEVIKRLEVDKQKFNGSALNRL